MDRQGAIDRLPEAHAMVLRMHDSGHSQQEVADSLQIPVEAVGTLLAIAGAKLSALLDESSYDTDAAEQASA